MKEWFLSGLCIFGLAGAAFNTVLDTAPKHKCRTVLRVCTGRWLSKTCEVYPLKAAREIKCKACSIKAEVMCD